MDTPASKNLVDFSFLPLKDIPINLGELQPGVSRLNWFCMSDGAYALNFGEHRLFEHSKARMEYLRREFPHDIHLNDDAHYYVIRIYEDLLEHLPETLYPVSESVHSLIHSDEAYRSWRAGLAWLLDAEGKIDDPYDRATSWFGYRKLGSGYLNEGPDVWFWRCGDTIHVRWDNEEKRIDGIQPWTATFGHFQMTVEEFMRGIRSFHNAFMSQMGQRVEELKRHNPFVGASIDVDAIAQEHIQRTKSLEEALAVAPQQFDWSAVMAANKQIRNGPP